MLPQAARCAWCGADLGPDAERAPGGLRCGACGVVTTDPWPSDEELRLAYDGWYRPQEGRFSSVGDAVLRRSRGLLARRLDGIAPAGEVLDVGAGDGALLDALHAVGRRAVGLERASTRHDVMAKDIDELAGSYAAVVFWHSLEHLAEPGMALDRAAALLEPGGVLAVAVPNRGSIQARLFGERWFALDPPRHLVHISADALVARLRALGLEVERESHIRGGQVLFGWLHGLVGSLPGAPDLYDAIRRPSARRAGMSASRRAATLAAAVAALPAAAVGTALELVSRRGGTVYVEARHG
jgi:SAM-dependent methyltransferase